MLIILNALNRNDWKGSEYHAHPSDSLLKTATSSKQMTNFDRRAKPEVVTVVAEVITYIKDAGDASLESHELVESVQNSLANCFFSCTRPYSK